MRKVNVVFDTSVLFPDTDVIVSSGFEDFVKEFSEKCDLKLYIPEIVKGELCYQKVSNAKDKLERARQSLSRIGKILDRQRKTPYKIEELRPLVEKRFDKWAKSKNIILLEAPYNKISLKELQENSVWRVPPFEDVRKNLEHCKKCRAEKGFRDALILFSVLESVKKIKKGKVYFICNDKLLLEAFNNYNKNKRLVPLGKIEELSSRLRLSFEEDNEKWINLISNKAREIFLRRVWEECNIQEEIKERHPKHFEIPSTTESSYLSSTSRGVYAPTILSGESRRIDDITVRWEVPSPQSINYPLPEYRYIPLDEGRYFSDNPSFQEVENNNIYIWKSRVSHHKKYNELWSTGITFPKVYKIHFDVIWSAKVTKDERFYKLKLLDVEFIDKEFEMSLDLD